MKSIDIKLKDIINKEIKIKNTSDKNLMKIISEIDKFNLLSSENKNNFPLKDTIGKRIYFNTVK